MVMGRPVSVLLVLAGATCAIAAQTFYVDPMSEAEGAPVGSLERPFLSWEQVTFEPGNEYLQRRGTVAHAPEIRVSGGVTLGAYGEGDPPRIVSSAAGRQAAIAGWRTSDVTIQDLDISAPEAVSLVNFSTSDRITIARCRLHGAHWGIRLTGDSHGHRILDTEILDIRDDGIFIQQATDFEIARCHIHRVNQNWKPPYTPQEQAGGDAIQLSRCDRWHVHHNVLDRTNSGNKFCFISSDAQTSGVFEHNRLRGPLTTGDGGASMYFGHGGANLIVRYNVIEGPSPGAVYHHIAALTAYGNIISDMSTGFTNYGAEPVSDIRNNVFLRVAEPHKGRHYQATGNLDVTPADGAGAQTLRIALGGLSAAHAEGRAGALPAAHSGPLSLEAAGPATLALEGREAEHPVGDVLLQGTVEVAEGTVTGGSLVLTAGDEAVATVQVAAEGFALERMVAARIADWTFHAPGLDGFDLRPWQAGAPLGAWLVADLDGQRLEMRFTSGAE